VSYVNGDALDDLLMQRRRTPGSPVVEEYYLNDHQGSVRKLTDASGNVVNENTYDTFGTRTGSATTRFGYTRREHDPDTGLMYYRARWYSPETGRFVSEDPIGFEGGINLYAYVENNPVNLTEACAN
jgi:RHS repeat-associated protein